MLKRYNYIKIYSNNGYQYFIIFKNLINIHKHLNCTCSVIIITINFKKLHVYVTAIPNTYTVYSHTNK